MSKFNEVDPLSQPNWKTFFQQNWEERIQSQKSILQFAEELLVDADLIWEWLKEEGRERYFEYGWTEDWHKVVFVFYISKGIFRIGHGHWQTQFRKYKRTNPRVELVCLFIPEANDSNSAIALNVKRGIKYVFRAKLITRETADSKRGLFRLDKTDFANFANVADWERATLLWRDPTFVHGFVPKSPFLWNTPMEEERDPFSWYPPDSRN